MPRRMLPMLAAAALLVAVGCSSPTLNGATSSGTVHARVVDGPGGARLLVVPVFFANRGPYDFALDTGAARTVIDTRVVNQLRLPTTGSEQAVTGVSGTSEAMRVHVASWRVDSVALPDTTVLSLRLPAGGSPTLSGLLGSDMLGRYRTVTIDYQTGTITLR